MPAPGQVTSSPAATAAALPGTAPAPVERDRPPASAPGAGAPETFTPEQVAARLGCSAWWVTEQVRRGRADCLRFGRRVRFDEAQVRALRDLAVVRAQARRPQAAPADLAVFGATRRSQAAHSRRRSST